MTDTKTLQERYLEVRAATEELARPLSDEDQQLQSMPLASPTKWHRAHTTWFFETFLLQPAGIGPHDDRYGFLFNSYYDGVGARVAREKRGLLSRPSAQAIGAYRRAVDGRVLELLRSRTKSSTRSSSSRTCCTRSRRTRARPSTETAPCQQRPRRRR